MGLTSVVIPVWGPQAFLDACLRSLEQDDEEHEIVCVDNGTGYSFPPYVTLIRNEINRGFAVASNQGATVASGETLVMLNLDTEVTAHWLAPLLAALDHPNIAMSGPKLLYPPPRTGIQCAGIVTHNMGGHNRTGDESTGLALGVTGACMALNREVFEAAGRFDENYWNGFEDVDLCLTIRQMGYDIWYESSSIVYHHEEACGPERWTKSEHNASYLRAKWAGVELREL